MLFFAYNAYTKVLKEINKQKEHKKVDNIVRWLYSVTSMGRNASNLNKETVISMFALSLTICSLTSKLKSWHAPVQAIIMPAAAQESGTFGYDNSERTTASLFKDSAM